MFRVEAAKSYLPHITIATQDASAVADQYTNGDFYSFLSRLAFDMFYSVMYGTSPGTADQLNADPTNIEFVQDTQQAFTSAGIIIMSPQEKMFKTDRYNTFVKAMDKALLFSRNRTMDYVDMISSKKEDSPPSSSDCPVTGENGIKAKASGIVAPVKNLFSRNGDKQGEDSSSAGPMPPACVERMLGRGEMSEEDISSVVGDLLLAGVDTTAYIIGWNFLNLATNTLSQDKLASELESVLGGDDLTVETIDKLPYLKACIRESLRVTPVFVTNPVRRLPNEITLRVHTFPAGTKFSLNAVSYQMDPTYVDSPQEYHPERWLKDEVQKRKGTPASVIDHRLFATPFGSGARMCLGARVAEVEIMAAMARLVQDWKFELDPPTQELTTKQGLFIKADPYPKFILERRV